MINYEVGKYGFALIFQLTGSVLPQVFVVSLPCSLVCIALKVFLQSKLDEYSLDGDGLKLFSGFTAMVAFLIVFRSNHAYNKWWEGCTFLLEIRGEWFNAYTSSLAFCRSGPEHEQSTRKFQHQFARLLSLLYNCALQQVTSTDSADFEVIALEGFETGSMMFLANAHNRVEVVFQWVQKLIAEAAAADIIHMDPPLLSRVFNQLAMGMVKVNNARKISEFPMPFPFAQLMTIMLMLNSAFTILLCARLISSIFGAALLTFVVVGSFFGVNFIAVEIEAPFGDDANDLPLLGFARDMNDSLIELLRDHAQRVPGFVYIPLKHNFCETETSVELERRIHSTNDRDASGYNKNTSGTSGTRVTWAAFKTTITHRNDGEMSQSAEYASQSQESTWFSAAGTVSTSRKVTRKSRRTLAIKDSLARLDVRKNASEHVQDASLFVMNATSDSTQSTAQMNHSISDAPTLDVDDGENPSVQCPRSVRAMNVHQPTPSVEIRTAQSWDATTTPNRNLRADVDFTRAAARMENHFMQIATNVHFIKETIANATAPLQSVRFSTDTSTNDPRALGQFQESV